MPHPVTYDSLLVHYLARELHDRLAARRLRRVRFDADARRFTLELDDERLVWELHPSRGWMRRARGGAEAAEGWGGRGIRTQRRPRVRRVTAPPDERILEIEIDAGGPDRASRFVVELMSNQWNVLALDPVGRIVSALWPRRAGGRVLQAGAGYVPPGGQEPREGVDRPVPFPRFREILADTPADERRRALVRAVAWTSPLNAPSILAPVSGSPGPDGRIEATGRAAAGPAAPESTPARVSAGAAGTGSGVWEEAYGRYATLAARPDPEPRVLDLRGGQPYPLPLPGVDGQPASSLLESLERISELTAPAGLAPEVGRALRDRMERLERRARALREELDSAPEKAASLRRRADLLMARLHAVPKGAATVELEDFEGGTVRLELDPSVSAVENAERLYDRARKRERAARRLPARVREASAERDRLAALLESVESGAPDQDALAYWVSRVRPTEGGGADPEERAPFRSFRSSGGLEIRVGRSGRANDDLTFHHSAPDDIWLHARDAAGAHVILRWGDRDHNPPRRDLLEAAVLAALNSKARTSATVPVDWTRRKYVRSPRNAPPGRVIPDRVSTLFVEPDPEVEERLRERKQAE